MQEDSFVTVRFTPHRYTIRAIVNGQARTVGVYTWYTAAIVEEGEMSSPTNTQPQSTR